MPGTEGVSDRLPRPAGRSSAGRGAGGPVVL